MIYCQPIFLRGAGLGTRLFPWAKSKIFSQQHQIPMLYPQWVQPRLGPLLRGGIDLHCYTTQILLLNLFYKQPDEVGGLKRQLLQRKAKKQLVAEGFEFFIDQVKDKEDVILQFKLDEGYFETLHGFDQFLLQHLRSMTKKRWLKLADDVGDVPIAINVRCGNDFREAKTEQDYYTKGAIKSPLQWYMDSLTSVREAIGYAAKAIVVSDGTPEQLQGLLDMENVVFHRPGCAISDLLLLSRAQIFIASGGSSFSAWASFLGQMPTISHPGQSLTWFKAQNRHGYYVGEFSPAAPDPLFLEQAQVVLKR